MMGDISRLRDRAVRDRIARRYCLEIAIDNNEGQHLCSRICGVCRDRTEAIIAEIEDILGETPPSPLTPGGV
jgi:hypothetical protein